MSKKTIIQRSGMSTLGALTILFIAFKLANIITWKWIWVLAPIWIPTAIIVGSMLLFLFIAGIGIFIKGLFDK